MLISKVSGVSLSMALPSSIIESENISSSPENMSSSEKNASSPAKSASSSSIKNASSLSAANKNKAADKNIKSEIIFLLTNNFIN